MDSIALIFDQYIKDLKITSTGAYIFVFNDMFFGPIIVYPTSSAINMIKAQTLPDKYMNKMISVDVIKGKTIGYETDIGVLHSQDYITQFNCRAMYDKVWKILYSFVTDINRASTISRHSQVNTDMSFYNNIMIRKSDEGAGKFIMDDQIMYIAPCMLPATKSNEIDVTGYYIDNCDYYVASFTTHKKTNDVITMMKFLRLT